MRLHLSAAIQWATEQLQAAFPAASAAERRLEAEILIAYTLDVPRSYLYAWPEQPLSAEAFERLNHFIERRKQYEPIAYITGIKEFWSLPFIVTPATLIPRPETELLVETVLGLFEANRLIRVADLGTGSGAIAIALQSERPQWQIVGVDNSENALEIARKNAQQFGLDHISFQLGSWCTALPTKDFDVIVSNPPYISEDEWEAYAHGLQFEPQGALLASQDGLSDIQAICSQAANYLKPGGYLLIEHGYRQKEGVQALFAEAGFTMILTLPDQNLCERVTLGRK